MPTPRQQKQQQDLGIRLEQLKSLFTLIQQEIEQLSLRGELAPLGAWIVRYQAKFRGRQAPPKPEVKRVASSKPPRQIPSLLTRKWMGVGRKDEGVLNVW